MSEQEQGKGRGKSRGTCEGCVFWEWDGLDKPNLVKSGECRRSAPGMIYGLSPFLMAEYCEKPGKTARQTFEESNSLNDTARALWPITLDYHWCGEHKPKE